MEFASARRAARQLRLSTLSALFALAALLPAGSGGCRRHRAGAGPKPEVSATPPATARLEGRVLDGRAHPVPDARVLAFPIADGGAARGEPGHATADLEGHFAIDHLAAGAYRILVEAAGFSAAETSPVSVPAADLTLHVAGEGRSIAGRVEQAGNPAAGARVLLAAEAGGPVRETVARADGRFAFSGLGEGTYALRAVTGALASPTVRGVAASRDGATLAAPLQLGPAGTVAGRLVQDSGEGLGATEVRAESAALAPGDDPLPALTRTDPTGAFVLGPLPPDGYRITAARAGFVLRHAPRVTLAVTEAGKDGGVAADDTRGEKPPVKLELVRGAQVLGRVTDARGAPAGGAHVRCVASAMDDLTVQSGPLPLAAEAAAMPSGAGRALGSTRSAIADARGRFVVDDLIPGRYRVEVAHAGLEPLQTDELALAPGERRDLGALVLRDGFPVAGRVVDDGGPVEGARVTVSGGDPSTAELYALTDGSGTFSLALPAGSYRLIATAPGHGPARAQVVTQPGTSAPPLELRLRRAEAVLEGLVRDTGGRPLARARLLVWPRDVAPGGTAEAPLGSGSADVGGHFRLADLPAGELRVEIQHPDYPRVTLPATAGQFASLTVPFPGGIAGEARARASGAPVTRGRVEAAGPDGATASAEIQRAGSFRLPRLAPGHWRITVSAPGFHAAQQELDVPASESLGEPSVRDVRVELDPT